AFVVLPTPSAEGLVLAKLELSSGSLRVLDLGKGSVAFAATSPDGKRVAYTRSVEGGATLEGELFVAPADDLAAAKKVPTPGVVPAPRWTSDDRVVFPTADALIAQGLGGEDRVTLAKAAPAASRPKDR